MADVFVWDTSAFLTLKGREPGIDDVKRIISEAMDGRAELHASFVSLTEVAYITAQNKGWTEATRQIVDIKEMPVRWHHSDESLCADAARLKSSYKISFADAFVAATAIHVGGELIHKDPEFLALGAEFKQRMLPPKPDSK